MKLLSLLSLASLPLLGSGCSSITGSRHPDGTLTITSHRLLWKSEAIEFRVADTNFVATLKIAKSRSDEESIRLAAEAAARAAVQALVPSIPTR